MEDMIKADAKMAENVDKVREVVAEAKGSLKNAAILRNLGSLKPEFAQ